MFIARMWNISLISVLALSINAATALNAQCKCDVDDPSKPVNITVESRKNELGKTVVEFAVIGAPEDIADGVTLNISTSLTMRGGEQMVDVRGVLEVDAQETGEKPTHHTIKAYPRYLRFNERKDENLELSDDRRTAWRINASDVFLGGKALTNRHLYDEERFEVLFEKESPSWHGTLKIGVTNIYRLHSKHMLKTPIGYIHNALYYCSKFKKIVLVVRRYHAGDVFLGGKALTNRHLYNEERFEVLFEKGRSVWIGSLKFGVTSTEPSTFNFDFLCFDPFCGVWSHSDWELKVGDRVAVVRYRNETLNFYLNNMFVKSFNNVP